MRKNLTQDEIDKMKIGPDDTFQFSCKQCGKCCINRKDILLNAQDIFRLCKELQIKPEELIEIYGESYIGDDSRLPIVRLLPRGPIERCRFLENRKCSVHKAKPTVCAIFPLGRFIVKPDRDDAKIEYFFTHPDCNDGGETHTVQKWLDEFGIPMDDPFYKAWGKIFLQAGVCVRKAEKKLPEVVMQSLWNAIYMLLYLNYDIDKEFLPQFQRNMNNLLEMLQREIP